MKPLKGVKVLDLTQLNGFTTMELADYGAEVLKIERQKGGDSLRYWPPLKDDQSPYFAYLARGKKSLALNLKSEEGKEVFKRLVKEADVIVENFKVGTMEKMGLGYDVLKKINPGLVYGALSGFGTKGPLKDFPAYDIIAQAQSGLLDITGFPGQAPNLIGFAITDHASNLYLACGIMTALINRERNGGEGQRVDVSMLDAAFAMTEDKVCNYYIGRQFPTRVGNSHPLVCPYDVFKAKDGYCAIGVSTDSQWRRFCEVLELNNLVDDPKYAVNVKRGQNYFGDLREKLEAVTTTKSKFELQEMLIAVGVPAAAVNTIEEAMNQEQLKARKMLVEVEDKMLGKLKMPSRTVKFLNEEELHIKSAPMLGEDTVEVLTSLGYSQEEIEKLKDENVISIAEQLERV